MDLNNSNFTGEVYITLRANKNINQIILHAKDLSINSHVKLTEQIYEQVETQVPFSKSKRDVNESNNNELNISNHTKPNTTMNSHIESGSLEDELIISENSQVTHSSFKNIQIISITFEKVGDRLILELGSDLKPGIDYILELSFSGLITESLTGFYKSSYTDKNKEIK